ncbi:MAG: hypothetical protein ACM3PS_17890, partial [Syntrophothermus sp.]
MKVRTTLLIVTLLIILSLAGCNLPSGQSGTTVTPDAYTAAAMTVTALAATEQAGPTQPTPTLFATLAPTIASTNTSAPPPPPQASSTPSGTLFVTDVGANCRSGPGTNYDKVGSFAQGSYLALVGRNSDRSWWLLKTGNTNCWISASTGHTSGPLDNIPEVQAPSTPTLAATAVTAVTAATGPKLSDPVALVAELSYPNNCTSNTVQVAIRGTDNGNGINSVWLSYRYVGDNGYSGPWHNVNPNNNAAGGVYGFNYPIGAEA